MAALNSAGVLLARGREAELRERTIEAFRRVKSECRRSNAEGRMPKVEPRSALGFGLRISELGLLSAFGLRASAFKVLGLGFRDVPISDFPSVGFSD